MVEDSSMQAVVLEASEIDLKVEVMLIPKLRREDLLNVAACSVCHNNSARDQRRNLLPLSS